MLNIYYQIPVSVLTPVKLKTVSKVTKSNILVCVNENFQNQLLIDVQLVKELS